MILTTCPACAAPLAHDAPRCVRCKLRYCDATCQHDHWRRGHKQICKKIHRGGNAEQYYADKKYKEAVAVAVNAVVAAEEALGDEHCVTVDLKKCYALALYQYHFYGYDDYRDDLRKSIEIIEDLLKLSTRVNGKHHGETQYYLDNLATVREEQLDWCIHDLTPATFQAYRHS